VWSVKLSITLLQELAGKNAEMMEEVARVRLDLNARIERLENERRSKEDLYNRISALEKELSGQFVHTGLGFRVINDKLVPLLNSSRVFSTLVKNCIRSAS